MNTKVINFYAGPGSGKSTTAAGLFHALKVRGVECELVTEYAKDKVWEESFNVLDNQLYVFAKQHSRLNRLLGKVEYIITDAPLLFSLHYGKGETGTFKALVQEIYSGMNNIDIFIRRQKKYNPNGRMQTEEQAKGIDEEILQILYENSRGFWQMDGDKGLVERIIKNLYPNGDEPECT